MKNYFRGSSMEKRLGNIGLVNKMQEGDICVACRTYTGNKTGSLERVTVHHVQMNLGMIVGLNWLSWIQQRSFVSTMFLNKEGYLVEGRVCSWLLDDYSVSQWVI
jgi:hypothetical protein